MKGVLMRFTCLIAAEFYSQYLLNERFNISNSYFDVISEYWTNYEYSYPINDEYYIENLILSILL